MASISKTPNGRRTIQFVAMDGKRRSIRLGKAPQKIAETFKVRIEYILAAQRTGHTIDDETARWLTGLPEAMYDKLVAVGLVPARKPDPVTTLGGFLTEYVNRRVDVKPATKEVWSQVTRNLLEHFGEQRDLRTIDEAAAEDFKAYLFRRLRHYPNNRRRARKGRLRPQFHLSADQAAAAALAAVGRLPLAGDAVDELMQHVAQNGGVVAIEPFADGPEVVGDPLGFGVQVCRVGSFVGFGQFRLDSLPLGPDKRQLLDQLSRVQGPNRLDQSAHLFVQFGRPLLQAGHAPPVGLRFSLELFANLLDQGITPRSQIDFLELLREPTENKAGVHWVPSARAGGTIVVAVSGAGVFVVMVFVPLDRHAPPTPVHRLAAVPTVDQPGQRVVGLAFGVVSLCLRQLGLHAIEQRHWDNALVGVFDSNGVGHGFLARSTPFAVAGAGNDVSPLHFVVFAPGHRAKLACAGIAGILEQPCHAAQVPAALWAGKALRLQLASKLPAAEVRGIKPLEGVLYGVDLPLIGAGQQAKVMSGLMDTLAGLQAAHKRAVTIEQTSVHSIDRSAAVVAAPLGGGDPAPQRLGRHFQQEVVVGLLVDEQEQLLGEVLKVDAAFAASVQPHAGLAQLVVEPDGVHRVLSGKAIGVPSHHHFELAGPRGTQQCRQPRPRVGAAIACDGLVGEPFDDLATLAGGKFGDFGALFGRRLLLLPAGHANVPGGRG